MLSATKETRDIRFLPHGVPLPSGSHSESTVKALADMIVGGYSPTIKGNVNGKFVPNGTAIILAGIRALAGERMYQNTVDRLQNEAKLLGYDLEVKEYTAESNPFK